MLSLAQPPEIAWKVVIDDVEPTIGIFSKEVYAVDEDGNIYIGGDALFQNGEIDLVIYKFSSDGDLIWKRVIGNPDTQEVLVNFTVSNQGELIAMGTSNSCDGIDVDQDKCLGGFEAWIHLINTNGDVVETKVFSGSLDDFMFRSGKAPDGSILVSGGTDSQDGFFSENKDSTAFFLAKFDNQLELQWLRYTESIITDISISEDNFIYASSEKRTVINGDDDIVDLWIYKYNAINGEQIFIKKIDGNGRELHSRIIVNNNNIFIGLRSSSDNNIFSSQKGVSNYFLIKLDLNGNVIWSKNYGGRGIDSFETLSFDSSDKNILLCGEVFSDDCDIPENIQFVDTWLIKVDAENGDIIWSKIYDIEDGDSEPNHFLSPSGEIIILSDIFNSQTVPEHSIVLAKLKLEKNENPISVFDFTLAPNPNTSNTPLQIFSESLYKRDVQLELVDITGRVLWSISDLFFASNPMEISNPLLLSPGLYYVRLSTQDINMSKPLVIID